jgi:hypothetical protein
VAELVAYRVTVNMVGARLGDKVMVDPNDPKLEAYLAGPHPKIVPWEPQEAAGASPAPDQGEPQDETPEELWEAPGVPEEELEAAAALPLPDDAPPSPEAPVAPHQESPAVAPAA